jgi:hypothetical protein
MHAAAPAPQQAAGPALVCPGWLAAARRRPARARVSRSPAAPPPRTRPELGRGRVGVGLTLPLPSAAPRARRAPAAGARQGGRGLPQAAGPAVLHGVAARRGRPAAGAAAGHAAGALSKGGALHRGRPRGRPAHAAAGPAGRCGPLQGLPEGAGSPVPCARRKEKAPRPPARWHGVQGGQAAC